MTTLMRIRVDCETLRGVSVIVIWMTWAEIGIVSFQREIFEVGRS